MTSNPRPIVGIGTELPAGTVVAIKNDHILIETTQGRKPFTQTQVEQMVANEIIQQA